MSSMHQRIRFRCIRFDLTFPASNTTKKKLKHSNDSIQSAHKTAFLLRKAIAFDCAIKRTFYRYEHNKLIRTLFNWCVLYFKSHALQKLWLRFSCLWVRFLCLGKFDRKLLQNESKFWHVNGNSETWERLCILSKSEVCT